MKHWQHLISFCLNVSKSILSLGDLRTVWKEPEDKENNSSRNTIFFCISCKIQVQHSHLDISRELVTLRKGYPRHLKKNVNSSPFYLSFWFNYKIKFKCTTLAMSKELVECSRNGITIKKFKFLLPSFWRYNDLHGCFITKLQNAVKNDTRLETVTWNWILIIV